MNDLLIGILGSIIASILIAVFARTRAAALILGSAFSLAHRLRREGVSEFHFSRDDYRTTLRSYLSQAKHLIEFVSVSLAHKEDEGDLTELFRQCLNGNPVFRITVSLLNPCSPAVDIVSESLGLSPASLRSEIRKMLEKLLYLKGSLAEHDATRLNILLHNTAPMGSAILLDAGPTTGIIQVETKLHRAPRTESFGFEVKAPSPFYGRQYRAWSDLLRNSRPASAADLVDF
jgi:hypothetical protein